MTDTCLGCGSKNIVVVEYSHDNPRHYDGISEILCIDCQKRYGRWCQQELYEGEAENPYCSGESHE